MEFTRNSESPNLRFCHNNKISSKVEWITHSRSNLMCFTEKGYIIEKDKENDVFKQEYLEFDMNGTFIKNIPATDCKYDRVKLKKSVRDKLMSEDKDEDPEYPSERINFYGSFPNANDFADVLKLETSDGFPYLWHTYKYGDYVLTRVDTNYIISKHDTNEIVSIMHDPDTSYQVGDVDTYYYYDSRNDDLIVWNHGDVYSVVHIKMPMTKTVVK